MFKNNVLGVFLEKSTGASGGPFLLPLLFVAIYGSGFVGAKYGLPYAPPIYFLILRFAVAALIATGLAYVLKAPWPRQWRQILHISIAGAMTVGTFSVGVFVAIDLGVSPSVSALVIALHPIVVAVFAQRLLGEKVTLRQMCGLFLGLLGVAFVVSRRFEFSYDDMLGLFMCFLGLFGLSFGNLYQKAFCSEMNVVTGGAIQSFASLLLLLPFALFFEEFVVIWSKEFIGALSYMSITVSIGALSLLYVMIRRGEISRVASVFYFVPVSAAIISYFLMGEIIDLLSAVGIGFTVAGVVLANSSVGK